MDIHSPHMWNRVHCGDEHIGVTSGSQRGIAMTKYRYVVVKVIISKSRNQNKVSWCIIENDHNFERTEDCATVFLNFKYLLKNHLKFYNFRKVSPLKAFRSVESKNSIYSDTYGNDFWRLHIGKPSVKMKILKNVSPVSIFQL